MFSKATFNVKPYLVLLMEAGLGGELHATYMRENLFFKERLGCVSSPFTHDFKLQNLLQRNGGETSCMQYAQYTPCADL